MDVIYSHRFPCLPPLSDHLVSWFSAVLAQRQRGIVVAGCMQLMAFFSIYKDMKLYYHYWALLRRTQHESLLLLMMMIMAAVVVVVTMNCVSAGRLQCFLLFICQSRSCAIESSDWLQRYSTANVSARMMSPRASRSKVTWIRSTLIQGFLFKEEFIWSFLHVEPLPPPPSGSHFNKSNTSPVVFKWEIKISAA